MIVLARHLAAPAIAVLPLPVPNAISAMFVAGHAKFHCLCPASTVRLPRMSQWVERRRVWLLVYQR